MHAIVKSKLYISSPLLNVTNEIYYLYYKKKESLINLKGNFAFGK